MKIHSCWKRWQLVQRPSSEASNPEQRICIDQHHSQHGALGIDIPCAVCNNDTRWPFAASVPADSDSPCEVVPLFEGPGGRRVRTCHGEALRIACLGGLAGVEEVV